MPRTPRPPWPTLGHRQRNREPRSAPRSGQAFDLAVVALGDTAYERQSEADATVAFARPGSTKKWLEDALAQLGRDAGAAVTHVQLGRIGVGHGQAVLRRRGPPAA